MFGYGKATGTPRAGGNARSAAERHTYMYAAERPRIYRSEPLTFQSSPPLTTHGLPARLLWSAFAAPLPAGRRAASSAARDMPPCAHSAPSQRAASRSVLRAAPPRAPSRAASGLAHAHSAVSARSSWLAAAGGGVRSGCQRFRCCQPAASGDAPAARFAAGGPQSKRGRLCPPASGQKDAARRGASAELIAGGQHRPVFC